MLHGTERAQASLGPLLDGVGYSVVRRHGTNKTEPRREDILVDQLTTSGFDLAGLEMEIEKVLNVPVGIHTLHEFKEGSAARVSAEHRTM